MDPNPRLFRPTPRRPQPPPGRPRPPQQQTDPSQPPPPFSLWSPIPEPPQFSMLPSPSRLPPLPPPPPPSAFLPPPLHLAPPLQQPPQPGPSQPPPPPQQQPPQLQQLTSRYNFSCFLPSARRLKVAMMALTELGQAQEEEEEDIFNYILVTTSGFQFQVVNGNRVIALFNLFPNSDISSFGFNDPMYAIDFSSFSRILERDVDLKDRISLFGLQGNESLFCCYGPADKSKTFKVPLYKMDHEIKYNFQKVEPLCTIVIKSAEWRKGILYLLKSRDNSKYSEQGVTFEVSWNQVKFYAGEDLDEDMTITYKLKENCYIKIQGGENQHEYTVTLPLIVESPLSRAAFQYKFGVIRLYFERSAYVTLSFDQEPHHQVKNAHIMFVYYPSLFTDRL